MIWLFFLLAVWILVLQQRDLQGARLASTLSTLVQGGRSPQQALFALRDSTYSFGLRNLLDRAARRVALGDSLADALTAVDAPLPPPFLTGLRLAEEAGMQGRYLELTAGKLKARAAIRTRFAHACVYPMFALCWLFFIAWFIAVYILPTFVSLFEGMSLPLPPVTRGFIAIMKATRGSEFSLVSMLLGAALVAALVHAPTRRRISAWLDSMLPPWRSYHILAICEQVGTDLGLLLASGLSLPAALDACARHVNDGRCAAALRQAAGDVDRGEPLSASLARQKAFPPLFTWSLAVGEKGEHLDEALLDLGGYYRDKMERVGRVLASLWQPVVSCMLGAVVFLVILAFWLPIYMLLGQLQ